VAVERGLAVDRVDHRERVLDFSPEAVLVAVVAVAAAPAVGDGERVRLGELWGAGVPVPASATAVQEDERRAVTVSFVGNTGPICGGDCLHGGPAWFLPGE
jgi:hypothetical protein